MQSTSSYWRNFESGRIAFMKLLNAACARPNAQLCIWGQRLIIASASLCAISLVPKLPSFLVLGSSIWFQYRKSRGDVRWTLGGGWWFSSRACFFYYLGLHVSQTLTFVYFWYHHVSALVNTVLAIPTVFSSQQRDFKVRLGCYSVFMNNQRTTSPL